MNTIGGLRALGFSVEGGRSGGKIYRVVGWAPKPEYKPAAEWSGDERSVLDWIEQLPQVQPDDRQDIESHLAIRRASANSFEACWGYLWSYELARDRGFLYRGRNGTLAVVIWKFQNFPRLRIFNIDLRYDDLAQLASMIAPASLMKIRVVHPNIDPLENYGKGDIVQSRKKQAWYRCEEILDRLPEIYSKKQRSLIRQHQRKTIMISNLSSEGRTACHDITKIWKKANEVKQRQLAITRDFVAIDDDSNIALLGVRDDSDRHPACFQILSRHPGARPVASQLVEKALNYRELPGGQSGTSDYSFVEGFQVLLELGVTHVNGGDLDGGTPGLAHHKLRLSLGETVSSYGLTFEYSILDREKYRV